MALFEFERWPVERIAPWGEPGSQTLSWFALSYGNFRVRVGSEILFRYSPELLSRWGGDEPYADYQVAAFARDILGSAAAGAARLPQGIECFAAQWDAVVAVLSAGCTDKCRRYASERWVGERSPSMSYLVACPSFSFVRVGDDVFIHWDNRACTVDGFQVWTATKGAYSMPVAAFRAECRNFADRLLGAMTARIADIEAGRAVPQVAVDVAALREQDETWRKEFESTLAATYEPEIPWEEVEDAMASIARERGIVLPP